MNLEQIKILAERRRMPFKTLAANIGMSEGNLHRCVRENKIQATDLEKIASVLGVDVSEFFDEQTNVAVVNGGADNNMSNGNTALLKERITHLEERIKDKDELIQLLRRTQQ
jgi:DNA-binding Xre family transcriptional regulator